MHVWSERGGRTGALVALVALAALAALAEGDTLSACDALHQKYAEYGGPERWASESGRAREVRVYAEARAPSLAAAALLAAGLRHRLRCRVQLHRASARELCALADAPDPTLVLVPALAWGAGGACALQGRRGRRGLRAQGAGAASARLRLLAHLARRAAHAPPCRGRRASRWSFYRNHTTLETCSFLFDGSESTSTTSRGVKMYYPAERIENATDLAKRAARFGLRLRPVPLERDSAPRSELLRLLREGNTSFLFLDYEIWSGLDRVHIVDAPPDENELDLTHTVRVADTWRLRRVAPDILQAFHRFEPRAEDLRRVLEIEAESRVDIAEAACTVASNNSEFESWFRSRTNTVYEIAVHLCRDDPDYDEHTETLHASKGTIADVVNASFGYQMRIVDVQCGDSHAVLRALLARAQSAHWARFAGALAPGAGAAAAAAGARALGVALVLYAPAPPARGARLATGRPAHLARALRHFVARHGWTRVAVLSDGSHLASVLAESLRAASAFAVRNVDIDSSPKSALRTLRGVDARIVFVNSNASAAARVLCAARDLGMTSGAGYVWILRDWSVAHAACPRGAPAGRHFTISFAGRGGDSSPRFDGTSAGDALDATRPEGAGPRRAAPLADALVLLLRGFKHFLHDHPARRHDLHGGGAPRLFWENLDNRSAEGATRTSEWDEYGLTNPLVYVDEWRADRRDPLAVWRVDDGEIVEVETRRPAFPGRVPGDGAAACLARAGRAAFSPRCRDGAWLAALAAGALAAPALLLARRARRGRLAARRRARAARLLRLAAPLGALLVERGALRLRGELGAGRFGVVREAELRAPGRARVVAAKALRDDCAPAEEREFLNEALMLASLRHERVVRVVGVCVGGGPPLVLMERAFFRDLLSYLRERRPLAEAAAAAAEGEAAHVAAPALTRLAGQAAAALAYLGAARVVHRDVRAANCLVDARRALKLADFGLARRAPGGAYRSRRRAALPVPWMAPESLERGVFSAASDAWGLGVLLLELVTLGARPYGAWPPQRVLRYVSAGGRPPLPPDVTPETRRVLAACWRRAPGLRARAADLRARLAARPALLAPALAALPGHEPGA